MSSTCLVVATDAGLLHSLHFREVFPPTARLDTAYERRYGYSGDPGGTELPPSLAIVRPLGSLEVCLSGSVSMAGFGASPGILVQHLSGGPKGKTILVAMEDDSAFVLYMGARLVGEGRSAVQFARMDTIDARVWPGQSASVRAGLKSDTQQEQGGNSTLSDDCYYAVMPAPSQSGTQGGGIRATGSGMGMIGGAAGGASMPSVEEARGKKETPGPGMYLHDWVLRSDTYESGAGALPGRDPDPAVANGAAVLAMNGSCIAKIPAPRAAIHSIQYSAHGGGHADGAVGCALSADFVVTQHVVWQHCSDDAALLCSDADGEEMAVHRIVLRGYSSVHPSLSDSSAEKPSLHVVCQRWVLQEAMPQHHEVGTADWLRTQGVHTTDNDATRGLPAAVESHGTVAGGARGAKRMLLHMERSVQVTGSSAMHGHRRIVGTDPSSSSGQKRDSPTYSDRSYGILTGATAQRYLDSSNQAGPNSADMGSRSNPGVEYCVCFASIVACRCCAAPDLAGEFDKNEISSGADRVAGKILEGKLRDRMASLGGGPDGRVRLVIPARNVSIRVQSFDSVDRTEVVIPTASVQVEFVGRQPAADGLRCNRKYPLRLPPRSLPQAKDLHALDLTALYNASFSSVPDALSSLEYAGSRLAVGATSGAVGGRRTRQDVATAATADATQYKLRLSWTFTGGKSLEPGAGTAEHRAGRIGREPTPDTVVTVGPRAAKEEQVSHGPATADEARAYGLLHSELSTSAPPIEASILLAFHSDSARCSFVLALARAAGQDAFTADDYGDSNAATRSKDKLMERMAAHCRDSAFISLQEGVRAVLHCVAAGRSEASAIRRAASMVRGIFGARWVGLEAPGHLSRLRLPWTQEHSGHSPGDFVAPWPELNLRGGDRVNPCHCVLVMGPGCYVLRIPLGSSSEYIRAAWEYRAPLLSDIAALGALRASSKGGGLAEDLDNVAVSAFDHIADTLGLLGHGGASGSASSGSGAGEGAGSVHRAPALVAAHDGPQDTLVLFPTGWIVRLRWDLRWSSVLPASVDIGLDSQKHAFQEQLELALDSPSVKLAGPAGRGAADEAETAELFDRRAKLAAASALQAVATRPVVACDIAAARNICTQPVLADSFISAHDRMVQFRMHSQSVGGHAVIHLYQSRYEQPLKVEHLIDASSALGSPTAHMHDADQGAYSSGDLPYTPVEAARSEIEQTERQPVLRWVPQEPKMHGHVAVFGTTRDGRPTVWRIAQHQSKGTIGLDAAYHAIRDLKASLVSVHPVLLLRQVRSIVSYGRSAWREAVDTTVDHLLADGIKLIEGEHIGRDEESLPATIAWCDEGSSLAGASPADRSRVMAGWSQGDPKQATIECLADLWNLVACRSLPNYREEAIEAANGAALFSRDVESAAVVLGKAVLKATSSDGLDAEDKAQVAVGGALLAVLESFRVVMQGHEAESSDPHDLVWMQGILQRAFQACCRLCLFQLAGALACAEVHVARAVEPDTVEAIVDASRKEILSAAIKAGRAAGYRGREGLTATRRIMLRALLLRLDRMTAARPREGLDRDGFSLGQDDPGGARIDEYGEAVGSGRGHEHKAMTDKAVASIDRREAGALGGLDVLAGDVYELADLVSATGGGVVAQDEESRLLPASATATGAVDRAGHAVGLEHNSLKFRAVHDSFGLADLYALPLVLVAIRSVRRAGLLELQLMHHECGVHQRQITSGTRKESSLAGITASCQTPSG